MSNRIRKTLNDTICQYLITKGKKVVDLASPLSACKLALETIEEHNRDRFIEEVLNGLKNIDIESLQAEKSLERLYKTTQVIAKANTQEKINRFKELTINGIIAQDKISENDYELYLRMIDELTDEEFMYLNLLVKNIDININFRNDSESNKELSKQYNNANEIIKLKLKISDEKLNLYRNYMAGKGLINLAAAFGGLAFKNLAYLAYELINFININ